MRHRLADCRGLRATRGDPVASLERWRREPASGARVLLVEFSVARHWSQEEGEIPLTALYLAQGDELRLAVTDRALAADGTLEPGHQFARWVQEHGLLAVDPDQPLPLLPLTVPKPWGVEIWYTGVERRGMCRFGEGGRSVPIPWLRPALPAAAAGAPDRDLLLLKVLASRPEAVHGELYLELHRQKHEVYVILDIDPGAWPDGIGYMRHGICPQRLQQFPDPRQLRATCLAAAADYEALRRELDTLPPGQAPSPASLAEERRRREAVNGFTALRPLRCGDVVSVPTQVPHALLHGLRAIEFQTPSFERLILSFPQRVLTQDHWDSAAAVAVMALQVPPEPGPVCLEQDDGIRVERVAECPDFELRRVAVEGGRAWRWQAQERYALLVVAEGAAALGTRPLGPEQAVLLPAGWTGDVRVPQGAGGAVLFACLPR